MYTTLIQCQPCCTFCTFLTTNIRKTFFFFGDACKQNGNKFPDKIGESVCRCIHIAISTRSLRQECNCSFCLLTASTNSFHSIYINLSRARSLTISGIAKLTELGSSCCNYIAYTLGDTCKLRFSFCLAHANMMDEVFLGS